MKEKFAFYKNLILAVASALTLIAVSFAWFSDTNVNMVPSISGEVVNPTYANVVYYIQGDDGNYTRHFGDFNLENWTAGEFQKYRLVMTTATDEALRFGMSIQNLPADMDAELKKSVQVKYTVYRGEKKTAADGTVNFDDGSELFGSDYMSLDQLTDGIICEGRSLASYQSSKNDVFIIYYEIGLSADSSTAINGLSSSLGTFKINIQPVS